MSVVTETYARKSFEIEAIRVTDENMEDVAKWCGGELQTTDGGRRFIKVDVTRPLSDKQTMAFVGDWVLKVRDSFKVYQHRAFTRCFEKVGQDPLPLQFEGKSTPKIHMPANYPEPSTR